MWPMRTEHDTGSVNYLNFFQTVRKCPEKVRLLCALPIHSSPFRILNREKQSYGERPKRRPSANDSLSSRTLSLSPFTSFLSCVVCRVFLITHSCFLISCFHIMRFDLFCYCLYECWNFRKKRTTKR